MKCKNVLFTITFVFISSGYFYAQDGVWVEASGKYLGANVTPDEGRRKATDQAENNAIEQVVGIHVQEEIYSSKTETSLGDNPSELEEVFSKLTRSSTLGKIIKKEIVVNTITIENDIPDYKVTIKALVVEEKQQPDPSFEAKIIIPTELFYDRGDINKNDLLTFKLWSSKNAYLYLFTLSNDEAKLLIPSELIPNNFYSTSNEIQEFEKTLDKIQFRVGLPSNKNINKEALFLVALKDKVDFISENYGIDKFDVIPTYKTAVTDIMNWLIKIPRDRRTEVFSSYEIRKFKN